MSSRNGNRARRLVPALRDESVSLGELFCGAGGLSLGFHDATIDSDLRPVHSWAVDINSDAIKTFQGHFPQCKKALVRDVAANFDWKELTSVNGLAFGFPCNDFSLVGEQKGLGGAYGPLYKRCIKVVQRLQPAWFVAENVGGIRSASSGDALKKILGEFSVGYRLVPHYYRFEEYGIPQRRHRVIIVGIRADLDFKFEVPAPTHLKGQITARQAIEVPPIQADVTNQEKTRQSKAVVARLTALKPGQNAFSEDLPKALRLNIRGATISQIYRRLDPDQPAYTVTGSGGGGTHVYHWKEPRALTNRERARLQTFPDDFVFAGGKESVRRQIGMAVPPRAAKQIFSALFKTFQKVPYDHVDANLASLLNKKQIETSK